MIIMLKDYSELMVCDYSEFGLPLGFKGNIENLHSTDQIWKYKNHKGVKRNKDIYEQQHEISNNVVCATCKGSDQPEHTRSLIRDIASHLNIL